MENVKLNKEAHRLFSNIEQSDVSCLLFCTGLSPVLLQLINGRFEVSHSKTWIIFFHALQFRQVNLASIGMVTSS